MAGTLFLVATPIGNLEDITYRAVRVLRESSVIACEDTRQTRKLLDHFGIGTPLVSYHEHNEAARTADLCERLEQGADVALVSDAGTPLISDPGFRLVSEAVRRGFRAVPVPGPSAALAALSAAGLPAEQFAFLGFPPRKPAERRRFFDQVRALGLTAVVYEAPHRILQTLEELAEVAGDPQVAAGREITKLHEEFLRGKASQIHATLAARDSIRGEFTLVVAPAPEPAFDPEEPLPAALQRLLAQGLPRMDAIKALARERGLSKREIYARLEENDGA